MCLAEDILKELSSFCWASSSKFLTTTTFHPITCLRIYLFTKRKKIHSNIVVKWEKKDILETLSLL